MEEEKKKRSSRLIQWERVLLFLIALTIVAGLYLQVEFNRTTQRQLDILTTTEIRHLVQNALTGVTDTKISPQPETDGKVRIPEVRLQLPATNENVSKLLYSYSEASVGYGSDDTTYDISASLEVTSKNLTDSASGRLSSGVTMTELFERVPQAQACTRGFTLQFEPRAGESDLTLSGTVSLADGRTLSIYREKICNNQELMDALEKYLLQAESY